MIVRYWSKKTLGKLAVLAAAVVVCLGVLWWPQRQPAAAEAAVPLPVLMYHSVLEQPSVDSKFIITPQLLESDLHYLKQQGYQFISVQQLLDYVYSGGVLPAKPLLLTFDDGYLNNKEYVLPLLEKYQAPALISVVGSFTQLYSDTEDRHLGYAHMNWQDLNEVLASGYVELGNHSYDLHSCDTRQGSDKLPDESLSAYQQLLRDDLGLLQEALRKHCGLNCAVYTYPYGAVSEESLAVVKELGFKVSFSTYEKINLLTRDPEALYLLGRFNRSGQLSTAEFMRRACL